MSRLCIKPPHAVSSHRLTISRPITPERMVESGMRPGHELDLVTVSVKVVVVGLLPKDLTVTV